MEIPLDLAKKLLMLNNNHIEKGYWHLIFPKHVETFQDFFAIPAERVGTERGHFSVENGSTIGSTVVVILRDRLRELTVIVVHSHSILILKTDM